MAIRVNTDVKGKEYAPFAVTVERGKIKEFCGPRTARARRWSPDGRP
jgi:hypothetical protein